jgi:6-phosphogluconolactonase
MCVKYWFGFILFSILPSLIYAQNQKQSEHYNLLVASTGAGEGIYVYDFNTGNGEIIDKGKFGGIRNPTFLTISRDSKNIYTTSKGNTGQDSIVALNFNPNSGAISLLNRMNSGGNSPSYVEVDNNNKFVFAANFGSGSVSAIPLTANGSLKKDIQTFQYQGSSIVKVKQDGPHVHCVIVSPDSKHILTLDRGTDRINIFNFDDTKESNPLTTASPSVINVAAGNGPRHLTFHPNGKYAYVVHELNGLITAYDYSNGKLKLKQTITMLSEGFTGEIRAADIHVSPDGNFLYGSNRGDANEIVIYSINKQGTLVFKGRQSSLGKTPRNFAIDPEGKYLLVGNEGSNEIVVFRRNKETGLLVPTGQKINVKGPVCLKFAATPNPEKQGGQTTLNSKNLSITVDGNVGARVTSLKLNGKEYLNLKTGEEKNYGSTFWLSPQDKWSGLQGILNASPFKVTSVNDTMLIFKNESDTLTGLTYTKQFNLQHSDTSVLVRYTITNNSKNIKQLAPWEVTRVSIGGLAFFPKGNYPALAKSNLTVKDSIGIIWYPYDQSAKYTRQKLFMNGGENWLAHLHEGRLFIKKFPHITPSEVAPGEGEIEIFSNKEKPFIELENQGRYQSLMSGESLTYQVKWYVRELPANISPQIGSFSLIEHVRNVVK